VSARKRIRTKRVAVIGLPILQEVGNLVNVALARHASRVGWRFILNAEDSPRAFRYLRKLDCDGAIVRITSPEMRQEAIKCNFPLVNISSWLQDPGVPTVRVDWRLLGQQAAAHLLAKGFRRFGCVIVRGGWYIQERYAAFVEAVRARGLEISTFHLRTTQPDLPQPLTVPERKRFSDWMLKLPPPAALVLTDDWDAPELMDICRAAGREIPRDLVVISTGIHAEVLPQCRPALSGAQEDLELQAQTAIELLEKLMAGQAAPAAPIIVPPLGVIERATTATMAIEDREVAQAVEFIRARCFESMNVSDVIERSGVSRGTLERRFKQVMGDTPHNFIVQQRIRRAQELLLMQPAPSLETIARQCGFRNRPELNRVFRRLMQVTPQDWRQRNLASSMASQPIIRPL
jgi:LacI family transcriptional regulator